MFVLSHSILDGLLHSKNYLIEQQSVEGGLQPLSPQGLLALVGLSLRCSLLPHTRHLASLISVICLSPTEMYLVTVAKA